MQPPTLSMGPSPPFHLTVKFAIASTMGIFHLIPYHVNFRVACTEMRIIVIVRVQLNEGEGVNVTAFWFKVVWHQ